MEYEAARDFADTWGLVFLVVIFLVIIFYIFRRGATERYKRAARIPMDAPENPADSDKRMNEIKSGEPRHEGTDPERRNSHS
jgi:cytochrome c oxidase cbb3-type subunit 4